MAATVPSLPLWARALIQVTAAAAAYWQSHGGTQNFESVYVAHPELQITKQTYTFKRLSAGAQYDDLAQFSLHHLNVTGGSVDNSWTEGDYLALRDIGLNYVNVLRSNLPDKVLVHSIIQHTFQAGDPPGPAVHEWPCDPALPLLGLPGLTANAPMPPQIACAVTLETAVRRHWGRIYLPSIAVNKVDSYGRFNHDFVDQCANGLFGHVAECQDADFPVVVYSAAAGSVMNVTGVRADDVADTIRRRRWKTTGYRKIVPDPA